MVAKQEAPPTVHPQEEIDRILLERVFIVTAGCTFPGQGDGSGPPLILREPGPGGQYPAMTVVTLPNLPEKTDALYPYNHSVFEVRLAIMAGTIEELVEAFRDQLTQAATSLVSSPVLPYTDTAKSVANAKQLGYRPGKALNRSFLEYHEEPVQEYLEKARSCYKLVKDRQIGKL